MPKSHSFSWVKRRYCCFWHAALLLHYVRTAISVWINAAACIIFQNSSSVGKCQQLCGLCSQAQVVWNQTEVGREGTCSMAELWATEQPHWELLWEWKVCVRHCISLAPDPKGISSFAPLLSSFRSTLVESCIYLFECWAVFAVNRRDSYLGCSLQGRRVCIPTLSMLVLRKGLKF